MTVKACRQKNQTGQTCGDASWNDEFSIEGMDCREKQRLKYFNLFMLGMQDTHAQQFYVDMKRFDDNREDHHQLSD